MKNNTLTLAALLVLSAAFTACEKEETHQPLVFHGTVEHAAKIEVDSNQLLWQYHNYEINENHNVDNIGIFDPSNGQCWAYATRPDGVPETQLTGATADFYVYQQYDDFDANASYYTGSRGCFPFNVYFDEGTENISNDVFTFLSCKLSETHFYGMPMVARSSANDPRTFHFKNAAALLKLTVSNANGGDCTRTLESILITCDHNILVFTCETDSHGALVFRTPTPTDIGMPMTQEQVTAILDMYYNLYQLSEINQDLSQERVYYIPILPNTYGKLDIQFGFTGSTPSITKSLQEGNTITLGRNQLVPISFQL